MKCLYDTHSLTANNVISTELSADLGTTIFAREHMTAGKRWNENETKLALYLYFQLPFGKLHKSNPEIIDLAQRLERTPSSIAMKLSNFASLDPVITNSGRKGLAGASELDRKIWAEFHSDWSKLIVETDGLMDKSKAIEQEAIEKNTSLKDGFYEQSSYLGVTELRIGQGFFRRSVLANYNDKCCITGIDIAGLLTASHIVPWKHNEANRHNPRNGLCLSANFDRAFDKGLMTIDADQKVRFSANILESNTSAIKEYFHQYNGQQIALAEKMQPLPEFLEWHRHNVFKAE